MGEVPSSQLGAFRRPPAPCGVADNTEQGLHEGHLGRKHPRAAPAMFHSSMEPAARAVHCRRCIAGWTSHGQFQASPFQAPMRGQTILHAPMSWVSPNPGAAGPGPPGPPLPQAPAQALGISNKGLFVLCRFPGLLPAFAQLQTSVAEPCLPVSSRPSCQLSICSVRCGGWVFSGGSDPCSRGNRALH